MDDEIAEELIAAAPGLFSRNSDGKFQVGNARDHEMYLEKVGACVLTSGMMLSPAPPWSSYVHLTLC